MTTAAVPVMTPEATPASDIHASGAGIWRQVLRSNRVLIGGGILAGIVLLCIVTLIWTLTNP